MGSHHEESGPPSIGRISALMKRATPQEIPSPRTLPGQKSVPASITNATTSSQFPIQQTIKREEVIDLLLQITQLEANATIIVIPETKKTNFQNLDNGSLEAAPLPYP